MILFPKHPWRDCFDRWRVQERIFSLCFSLNGGTMVLGGYDPRLNKPGAEMMYTPTTKSSSWFTVKVKTGLAEPSTLSCVAMVNVGRGRSWVHEGSGRNTF